MWRYYLFEHSPRLIGIHKGKGNDISHSIPQEYSLIACYKNRVNELKARKSNKMKMLDFIKDYNAYKLTESEAEKVDENYSELSERIELNFAQTEKCFIEAYATIRDDSYDEVMMIKVYEITDEDAYNVFEIVTSEQASNKNKESIFKKVATYKCNTDAEFKDFLITLIKNFDCDISV